jgi:hypothetical protein
MTKLLVLICPSPAGFEVPADRMKPNIYDPGWVEGTLYLALLTVEHRHIDDYFAIA